MLLVSANLQLTRPPCGHKSDHTLGGISWPFCPVLLGRLVPSSEEGFCWWVTPCGITGPGLNSQRSLDTCVPVMVQESIPSRCTFSYLELHYYNHWSYIELYIWSTASGLVNIFVGGSVIHLVIQEMLILWSNLDINGIVDDISGIKSKYFNHEPPTPNQLFQKIIKTKEWVT